MSATITPTAHDPVATNRRVRTDLLVSAAILATAIGSHTLWHTFF